VLVAVGFAVLFLLVWMVERFFSGIISRLSFASRARKRTRGYAAVSRGMVAVGAGDPVAARRSAREAERLLGREPLTLLLKAQAAQVSGDRNSAEAAFRRMLDNDETRVLGLRGLFVEARRRGDTAAARDCATEAARLAPSVNWANEAVLEARCLGGDWRGALALVERRASLGLLDKTGAKRDRAVLLAADALQRGERDDDGALATALEAIKLAPGLVPAAALAGKLLARRGELRRAARIVETAWKTTPHPDLAAVYLNLRPGDSASDRLRRAETLAKLSMWDPEARLTLARAALEAREFGRAREALRPLLLERPTMRACLLMADLEQAEHGASGRVREWLARAAHAPRDATWVADGLVSERWAPISPVTGRLDAFRWEVPPELLAGPAPAGFDDVDDVVADLDDKPAREPAPQLVPPPPVEPPAGTVAAAPAPEPATTEAVAVVPPEVPAPAPVASPPAAPVSAPAPASPPPVPAEAGPPAEPPVAEPPRSAEPAPKPNGAGPAHVEPAPVVFPVPHAPDDPGAEDESKRSRFRLFG
jgi:HemY protein